MLATEMTEFAQLLRDAMAFYKQDVSTFALQVWWQACQRFELDQVRKAMTAHVMDTERGQFPPKPADIVRQLEGTKTDRAMLAWGKVHEAMIRIGAYTDVVFDDPAIHAAVADLGGWVKMCRGEVKDLGYLQHQFSEAYRAYTGRGQFDYPRMLCGDRSPDDVYALRGLKPPKAAVIGDPEKARAVYLGGGVGSKVAIAHDYGLRPVLSGAMKAISVSGV